MSTEQGVLAVLAVSYGNYYLTTFTIWFGHWFAHLKRSPSAGFHVSGHHLVYLNSQNILSDTFRYCSGKQDSNFALFPPLVLQAALQYAALPFWLFSVCLPQLILIAVLIGYTHIQMHIRGSLLERFRWFHRARSQHAIHHDRDENYMVGDHFWDRVFGTYFETPFHFCEDPATVSAESHPL